MSSWVSVEAPGTASRAEGSHCGRARPRSSLLPSTALPVLLSSAVKGSHRFYRLFFAAPAQGGVWFPFPALFPVCGHRSVPLSRNCSLHYAMPWLIPFLRFLCVIFPTFPASVYPGCKYASHAASLPWARFIPPFLGLEVQPVLRCLRPMAIREFCGADTSCPLHQGPVEQEDRG